MHSVKRKGWSQLRWWIGIAAFLAYGAAGLSRLSYDVDVSRLLPQDLPETEGFRAFLKHFAQKGELIITVESPTSKEAAAASQAVAENLQSQHALVKKVIWQRDETDGDQWSELVAWSVLNQAPDNFRKWEQSLDPQKLPANLEGKIEQLAESPNFMESKGGYDPLGILLGLEGVDMAGSDEFGSADGKFRIMYVESAVSLADYRKADEWVRAMRSIAEKAAPEAKIRLTGDPAIMAEISLTMEADMKGSLGITLGLIALLVWLGYRSVRLLPMLAAALFVTFVLTLATCGLFLGSLTALTVGFGAILIGLSADYGVMLYQRSLEAGGDYGEGVRRSRLGIFWAAATTSVVFLALIPLGFPGLSQLGLLVAGGVVIGAFVMLGILPKALQRWGGRPRLELKPGWFCNPRWDGWMASVSAAVLLAGIVGLFFYGMPTVNVRSGSLRPKSSESFAAFDLMQDRLTGSMRSLSVLVTGANEPKAAENLQAAKAWLIREKAAGRVQSFNLPMALLNHPERRRENLEVVRKVVAEEERLRQSVEDAGFTEEAWSLAGGVIGKWKEWLAGGNAEGIRPVNEKNVWMLRKLTSYKDASGEAAALGFLSPGPGVTSRELGSQLPPGVHLAGNDVMYDTLNRLLEKGFLGITVLFGGITLGLLAFALRSWRTLGLVLLGISLSFGSLLGAMSWLGISWNFFTLPALLISLGTGSDYFIYVILELKQTPNFSGLREKLGRAIIVCVGNSVIGFGSLIGASCSGLASMGLVCALALTLNTLCALFLLPPLYLRWCHRPASQQGASR